jgi:hypothetical protein
MEAYASDKSLSRQESAEVPKGPSPDMARPRKWVDSTPSRAALGAQSLLYKPASSAWAKTWPFIAWRSDSADTPAGRSSAASSA